jgi:hypothetical protein
VVVAFRRTLRGRGVVWDKEGGLDVVGVGIGSWAADFGWFEGFDGVRGVESG